MVQALMQNLSIEQLGMTVHSGEPSDPGVAYREAKNLADRLTELSGRMTSQEKSYLLSRIMTSINGRTRMGAVYFPSPTGQIGYMMPERYPVERRLFY